MHIIFGIRRRNQKNQIRRLFIRRIVIHAVRKCHCSKSRGRNRVCLRVRNRNSLADSRRALLFPCFYRLFILYRVINVSLIDHQLDHLVYGVLLILRSSSELDAFFFQKFCDLHCTSSSCTITLLANDRISSRTASPSENALALPAATPSLNADEYSPV